MTKRQTVRTLVKTFASTLEMQFRSILAPEQLSALEHAEKLFDQLGRMPAGRPLLGRFCSLLAGMLVLCATTGAAQQEITAPALQLNAPSDTIASPVPGVGHDYIKMLNETVNPENGAVNLNISIPTPPGRGLNFPFSIQYNSNQALFLTPSFQNLSFGLQWFDGIGEFDQGAWSYGVPLLSRKPYVFNVTWPASNISGYDGSTKCGVMDSYMFTALDGSQYPLNLAHIYDNVNTGYNNSGGDYACAQVPWQESDVSNGGIPYSAVLAGVPPNAPDGSSPGPPSDGGTPSVTGPDGTTYVWNQYLDPACSETSDFCFGNPPSLIEDRNGNRINLQVTTSSTPAPQPNFIFNYSLNVTDTAGRPVVKATNFGQNGSTITVAGDPAPYTLNWENFTYNGYSLNVQNESTLPGNCPTANPQHTGSQTENVISSIELPNGQSYSFTYDSTYGMISRINYPSGGYVRYVYGTDPLSSNVQFNGVANDTRGSWPINGVCDFRTDTVAVTDRYVSFDGTNEVQHQHFSYGPTTWNATYSMYWAEKSTTVTTTDNVTGSSFATTYTYVGQQGGSGVNFANSYAEGVEQTITTSQGSTPLETVNKGWYGPTELGCEVDTVGAPGTAGSFSSAKYYKYAAGEQISDIKEYDYGQGNPSYCQSAPAMQQNNDLAPPPAGVATLSRETTVTYQSFATAPNLYDMPCWIKKQDGSGNVYAETDYLYDGATSTGCPTLNSATTTTSPVSNLPSNTHDELGYRSSSTTSRGNATTVTEKCLSGGCTADSTTTLKYDETGQITSITDPCGNGNCGDVTGSSHTTSYSYQDSPSGGNSYGNSNAFLTQITDPTTPGGVTLRKSFSYNYPTGELASATDENNQTTTYQYNDPLLRPTQVNSPDGGETIYSYNDAAPNPEVATTELMNSSGTWKTSVAILDGMRHTIQTQLISDPDGVDYVDTTYNGMGQVYSQSNPHRSSSSPTDGTSYSYYDALGRTVLQIHPDGSGLTWCYNGISTPLPSWVNNFSQTCNGHLGSVSTGTWVDGTDELGNDWQRTSDSFGDLTEVMEPNGSTKTPTMETDYNYDPLGNLLSIKQWGGTSGSTYARMRSFSYNSLSQLLSAANPETGTISYVHDLNGNISTKTDARGISVNYSYDNLNRPYQKTYKTGSVSTNDQVVCTQYDAGVSGATYPLGRLTMDWTQPGGSSCPGPASPQQNPPSNAISSRIISGYDVMGRLNGDQQCPLGSSCTTPYPFNYTYDLAGDAIQSILPISSGNSLTLASSWDSAQRLSAINVTGQPSGWNSSTYLNKPTLLQVAASTGYDPVGNLVKANLGVTATEPNGVADISRAFDNRARITLETDGGNAVNTPATQSIGSIVLSGSEASGTTQGTSGSGILTVSGVDGQQYECTTTYEWINAGDNGEVYEPVTTCDYVPDSGTLAVTIGGFTSTANYSSSSTDAAIASVLAAGFNLNGSPVRAVASGNSFTVTAIATGTSSNYPITISNGDFTVSDPNNALTGGTNGSTVYDAGTVTATITNNSVSPAVTYTTSAVSWGQGSTTSTLASSLASAINSAAGTIVTATANGGSVQLTSTATGSTTNYSVSASVNDTQKASYPSLFPSASFQASPNSMTGGTNLTSSYGTVYSYAVPAGGYAKNGKLLSYTDSTVMGTWNFSYDTLGRLASASSTPASGQPANPYPNFCWSYDSFGNRTTQMTASVTFASTQGGANGCSTTGSLGQNVWAQYNGTVNGTNNNQLSATSLNPNQGQSSGYDQAGNILYDGANKYLYDGEGRQCAVETGGNGGSVTGYLYNAEGLRVIKGSMSSFVCPNSAASFTKITAQYLLDQGGNQVTELDGSANWVHTNVGGGDATYTAPTQTNPGGLHFHLMDPLGTRRVQLAAGSNLKNGVSTAGMVEEYCLSEPYGDALNCYNPPGAPPTADDATEHHFTGKERDTESGNDYFKARYFASTMGRFMSPDWSAKVEPVPYSKLGDPQTLNLYAYVRNNPMGVADADGHQFPSSLFQVGESDVVECAAGVAAKCQPPPKPHTETTVVVSAKTHWWNKIGNFFSSLGAVFSRSFGSFGGARAGKTFTRGGRQDVVNDNAAKNGGTNVCENCGQPTVPAQQSQSGVTPPGNETNVDHIHPRAQGGDGAPSNGQVLCRTCNGVKSDSLPAVRTQAPPEGTEEIPVTETGEMPLTGTGELPLTDAIEIP